ncbi:MAG: helix-turn-helix domain-containing protein [Pirellulales bacterium]|nr:helix-turn-helix domain-containing protein [Pirellulales bacterium]
MITVDELATILGLSKRTIWRLLSAGEIPKPIRLGGSTRWVLAEIEAWIAAGCPRP